MALFVRSCRTLVLLNGDAWFVTLCCTHRHTHRHARTHTRNCVARDVSVFFFIILFPFEWICVCMCVLYFNLNMLLKLSRSSLQEPQWCLMKRWNKMRKYVWLIQRRFGSDWNGSQNKPPYEWLIPLPLVLHRLSAPYIPPINNPPLKQPRDRANTDVWQLGPFVVCRAKVTKINPLTTQPIDGPLIHD